MQHPFARSLDNSDLIQHFLGVVLKHNDSDNNDIITKIKSGEAELKNYGDTSSTLNSTSHRHRKFLNSSDRWRLREQIVNELLSQPRLDNDDNIKLGKGGALPTSSVQTNKQAYIIIGLPASGKSSIANIIADHYGAVVLDSDFAKRKFPEFEYNSAGASLVHDESNAVIFGFLDKDKPDDLKSVFEKCHSNGSNIVIPKIGYSVSSISMLANELYETFGYTVHLTLVSLDRRKATIRAVNRFLKSGRYVPLSLIFDGYGNDPILTYYRLKNNTFGEIGFIKSYGKLSTDVEKGQSPKVIYTDELNPACLFKE